MLLVAPVLALGALEAAFEEVAGGKVEQRKAEKGSKVCIPGCRGRIVFGEPALSLGWEMEQECLRKKFLVMNAGSYTGV